ncbi:MAG: 5'/3'-nucleotidase SurE [Halobacteriaceae archaeon]
MDEHPAILLTNDDGIDSPGLRALREGLSAVGDVTVVAPATDQSAVGRTMSSEVTIRDHDLGYAIEGTPSDCVVAGIEALDLHPDVVVSGCNAGANLGMYVLGRSGTVSAAVEAAFFGVPAVAASLYLPVDRWREGTSRPDYREAVDATAHLVGRGLAAGVFDHADYLNVNAPLPQDDGNAAMEVTVPSRAYDMTADRDGDTVTLRDRMWDRMEEGEVPDSEGTDRRAVVEGRVSVSPLTAPHSTERHESLDVVATDYGG